jgi:rubredoxin
MNESRSIKRRIAIMKGELQPECDKTNIQEVKTGHNGYPTVDICPNCGSKNVVRDINDSAFRVCLDCKYTYVPEKASKIIKRSNKAR